MNNKEKDSSTIVQVAKKGAEQSFDAQMELLKQFCSVNCGTRNREGNKKVVELVDAVLKEIGAEVEHIETEEFGTHIAARVAPENPDGKIILAAHLDTAFFGDTVKVEDHPFHIDGEYAYGLGVADCKGGVVTALYSVKCLKEAGLLPNKEIVMLFNCDEEVGSPTAMEIFKREAPSAEAIICLEPGRTKNGVLTERQGLAMGEIVVHGIATHAGIGGGASATRELANLILKLTEKSDPSIGMNYNVAPISGGVNSAMVADYARAEFCVPLATADVYEQVKNDVLEYLPAQGMVKGCTIETRFTLLAPPMPRREERVKIYEKLKAAADLIGLDLPEEASSATSDANFYAGFNHAVVDGLGPYMYDIHNPNEHMRIPTLRERTELLIAALATF